MVLAMLPPLVTLVAAQAAAAELEHQVVVVGAVELPPLHMFMLELVAAAESVTF